MSRLTIISLLGFVLVYWLPHIHCKEVVRWVPVTAAGKIIVNQPDPFGLEDGNPLFLCRCKVEGNRYKPGKLEGGDNKFYCAVSHSGVFKSLTFEMLDAPPGALSWVPIRKGGLPKSAVEAGVHHQGRIAYVCRGMFNKALLLGDYDAKQHTCYVATAGGRIEYFTDGIDILVISAYGLAL